MIKKICLLGLSLVYIAPLLIIFTNSFMSGAEIARNFGAESDLFGRQYQQLQQTSYIRFHLIPWQISLEQYRTLLFLTPQYLDFFINSVRLTVPIVAMHVVVGSLGAFGFITWQWRFKEWLFGLFIIVMVLPFQTTLVPNFIMADWLGLLNTHRGIILPLGFSPFAVFIMRQSMRGIPHSIFEAAKLDGAGQWTQFLLIALPMAKGGLAALVILTFADSWAMVEHPMVFLRDVAQSPLSVELYRIGQENIGLIFAASVFYMLPMAWLFIYGQEYFEEGVRLSALK